MALVFGLGLGLVLGSASGSGVGSGLGLRVRVRAMGWVRVGFVVRLRARAAHRGAPRVLELDLYDLERRLRLRLHLRLHLADLKPDLGRRGLRFEGEGVRRLLVHLGDELGLGLGCGFRDRARL